MGIDILQGKKVMFRITGGDEDREGYRLKNSVAEVSAGNEGMLEG